jgi:CheY-like chemotaxis protein
VVLLDIHMRPVDGFTILKALRAHERFAKTIVVAVTASVMNEEVALLKAAGFDGGIAKPIRPDLFPTLLNRLLQGEKIWYIA